jgi:hypothetical protein
MVSSSCMKRTAPVSDELVIKAPPRICDRCLEPEYRCGCLSWDLDARNQPDVAWVASRPLAMGSKVTREKKHRYAKACSEVARLNRLYAGKVQHFLLPVIQ